jgi:hypothetical protein
MDKITDNFSDPSGSLAPSFEVDILSDVITPQKIKIEAAKAGNENSAPQPVKMLTGEFLMNQKVDKIPCLLDPFFQQVGVVCLAGSSDVGKSTILRQLAIDVVMRRSHHLGWPLNTRHGSAIVVTTEDDPSAISFLLSRQAKGIDPAKLKGLRFLFEYENLAQELDAALTEQPADVVIVDCFADAYGGDLKDTTRIRAYLNICQSLAMRHQTLFLFLHHTSKRSENFEPNKNNLLAGQGFEAKMRCVVELRADPARADHRHWCVVKGNYLAADHKHESYVLTFDTDTFTFSATEERLPMEMLSKRADDGGRAKYDQAKALKDEGKTLEQIAKIMGYASKGSISKLLNKSFD